VAVGGRPVIEIMIPLTVTREELALARSWVEEAVTTTLASAGRATRRRLQVLIGTMIETPRAALRADEIAEVADFFSFGTNDLTQMTFGFSRDDVEGRMMSAYLEKGLLKRNPFETVDADGVGELVRLGVTRGRATRPSLKIGVCGEHGGDPESITVFAAAGCDYVSCSPFRVPIARLSAAQVVLADAAERVPTRKTATAKKRAPARKATARKATARKAVARKATARKTVAKKRAPARKATARKAVARKATARKATARKTVAKKRAPARKAAARKATATKRAPARVTQRPGTRKRAAPPGRSTPRRRPARSRAR
jgi:signal transduction protein with GAF and PtsI domain